MIFNHQTKHIGIILSILLTALFLSPSLSSAQNDGSEYSYYSAKPRKQKDTIRDNEPKYKSIPPSVFMTFHGGVQGNHKTDGFFNYQMPVFGFKIGTMKNTGWFLGMMTNFNYKGSLNTFKSDPVKTEKTGKTYIEGYLGLTGRYWKPLSFHFGVGYFYNTLNEQTEKGDWGHRAGNIKHGPVVTAGFMFHIRGFVLSLEVSGNYNIASTEEKSNFQSERVGLGAKAGIGFCIPRKQKQKKTENESSRDFQDSYTRDLRKQVPISMSPVPSSNDMLSIVR